ncbi:MAG: hypothetical protein ACOCUS_04760 [Polyangiales bacterium]
MPARTWPLLLCFVALAGCPGQIDDPEPFLAEASRCDVDVERDILQPRCSSAGCHDDSPDPAAELDLATSGVMRRLPDRMAQASGECNGRVLVVPGNPDDSLLYQKVAFEDPGCGMQMPLIGDPLTEDELACVEGWIVELGGGADGGVTDGGPADAASGAGATDDAGGTGAGDGG